MLNITYKPKEVKPIEGKNDKYSNPVGVWSVTTEGDVEGRSTTNLGFWRGHIAEIAFHLASNYTLNFKDESGSFAAWKEVPKDNVTHHKHVWISLGADSGTWGMDSAERAKRIAAFLKAGDQLTVFGEYKNTRYFAGVCLVLKD